MRRLRNALFGLRCLQILPNGIGGSLMVTDMLHKQVQRDFVEKMRYPWWFPTVLGAWKLSQLALDWVSGGAYIPLAQWMMAMQLGGAAFTHAVAEGKGFGPAAQGGPIMFFNTTLGIQYLYGALPWHLIVMSHLGAGVVGFALGYVVLALGPGGASHAAALSPVKWRGGGAAGFPKGGKKAD